MDNDAWLLALQSRVAIAIAMFACAAAATKWNQRVKGYGGLMWYERQLREMSGPEMYSVLRLRGAVFVTEQNCHYNDADSFDAHPQTLLIWADNTDYGMAAACARVVAPGVLSANEAVIGRVATRKDMRGRGLGREAMRRAVAVCDERWPAHPIKIGAETYLEEFYRSFGFEKVGAPYRDGAVMCISMERPALRARSPGMTSVPALST